MTPEELEDRIYSARLQLPENLQRLSRATRDVAQVKMEYKTLNDMMHDISEAIDMLLAKHDEVNGLERRLNEMRNSRESLLADIQDAYKKFDFTMRKI